MIIVSQKYILYVLYVYIIKLYLTEIKILFNLLKHFH